MNKKRLISKVKCEVNRLNKFSLVFPQYIDFYIQMASGLYYFVKIQTAKKVEGAAEIFQNLKNDLNYPLRKRLDMELKYYIYKYLGYNNVKKLYHLLMKFDRGRSNYNKSM